jgi:hypothetical protein
MKYRAGNVNIQVDPLKIIYYETFFCSGCTIRKLKKKSSSKSFHVRSTHIVDVFYYYSIQYLPVSLHSKEA